MRVRAMRSTTDETSGSHARQYLRRLVAIASSLAESVLLPTNGVTGKLPARRRLTCARRGHFLPQTNRFLRQLDAISAP